MQNSSYIELRFVNHEPIPVEEYSIALKQFTKAFEEFAKDKYQNEDLTLSLLGVEEGSNVFKLVVGSWLPILPTFTQHLPTIVDFGLTAAKVIEYVIEDKKPTEIAHVSNNETKNICHTCVPIGANSGDHVTYNIVQNNNTIYERSYTPEESQKVRQKALEEQDKKIENEPVFGVTVHLKQAMDSNKFKCTIPPLVKKQIEAIFTDIELEKIKKLTVGQVFDALVVVDGTLEFRDGIPYKLAVSRIIKIINKDGTEIQPASVLVNDVEEI